MSDERAAARERLAAALGPEYGRGPEPPLPDLEADHSDPCLPFPWSEMG